MLLLKGRRVGGNLTFFMPPWLSTKKVRLTYSEAKRVLLWYVLYFSNLRRLNWMKNHPPRVFVRCWTWREGIFVLVFKINKYVISFFFPNHCSMCDWISVYDHMMMLVRSLFHVYLIIIALYVVIMVERWMYNVQKAYISNF